MQQFSMPVRSCTAGQFQCTHLKQFSHESSQRFPTVDWLSSMIDQIGQINCIQLVFNSSRPCGSRAMNRRSIGRTRLTWPSNPKPANPAAAGGGRVIGVRTYICWTYTCGFADRYVPRASILRDLDSSGHMKVGLSGYERTDRPLRVQLRTLTSRHQRS